MEEFIEELVPCGTGVTALMIAAARGELKKVKEFARQGVNLEKTDTNDESAMVHAARCGQLEVVKFLYEQKQKNKYSCRSLMWYPLDRLGYLVESYLHPDEAHFSYDSKDMSLVRAAQYNRFEVVRWLIEQGVSANRGNEAKITPLMFAVRYGDAEQVKWLLDHGANPHALDKNANSIIDYIEVVQDTPNLAVFLFSQGMYFSYGALNKSLWRVLSLEDYQNTVREVLYEPPVAFFLNAGKKILASEAYFDLDKVDQDLVETVNTFCELVKFAYLILKTDSTVLDIAMAIDSNQLKNGEFIAYHAKRILGKIGAEQYVEAMQGVMLVALLLRDSQLQDIHHRLGAAINCELISNHYFNAHDKEQLQLTALLLCLFHPDPQDESLTDLIWSVLELGAKPEDVYQGLTENGDQVIDLCDQLDGRVSTIFSGLRKLAKNESEIKVIDECEQMNRENVKQMREHFSSYSKEKAETHSQLGMFFRPVVSKNEASMSHSSGLRRKK